MIDVEVSLLQNDLYNNTIFIQGGTVISLDVLLIDARDAVMVQFLTFAVQTMQGSSVSTNVYWTL